MRWILSSDHAGYDLKVALSKYLLDEGQEVALLGAESSDDNVPYADAADDVCKTIMEDICEMGILVCGTGIGVSMRANRYKGIRGALVHDKFTAVAAKEHSNANVLCFGARVLSEEQAVSMLEAFMEAEFEGGRHIPRLEMLDAPVE